MGMSFGSQRAPIVHCWKLVEVLQLTPKSGGGLNPPQTEKGQVEKDLTRVSMYHRGNSTIKVLLDVPLPQCEYFIVQKGWLQHL